MRQGDWTNLWRELASQDLMTGAAGEGRMVERWQALARRLDSGQDRPDPILDFIVQRLGPEMSVVDVGAGVGRWTIPLAARARMVTAVEPVAGMRTVLKERVAARGLTNVRVLAEPWLIAEPGPHDVVVAAYSMYTSGDLAAFARKMEATATRMCCLAMRVPAHDGVMGELSQAIHGEWHDSPNFIVGYNALLEAGFAPNAFMEAAPVNYWEDATLQAACDRARRHLRLTDTRFDALILETLERRLVPTATGYRWPDWMRAGIAWWEMGVLSAES